MGTVWWLGVVQGLTEFLPVSSSGHLMVLRALWGWGPPGLVWEAWLHGGTLIAVIAGYRREIGEMLQGLVHGRRRDWAEVERIAVATLPALLVGGGLSAQLSALSLPGAVVGGWLATTVLIWATPGAGGRSGRIADLTWPATLIIGGFQALALWPGLSRSGSTLFAGRRAGLSPAEAARLSFWMAIPTVLGAILLTLIEDPLGFGRISGIWLLGLIVAAVSGIFAIKWVRKLLASPRGYHGFGWYTLTCALILGLALPVGR